MLECAPEPSLTDNVCVSALVLFTMTNARALWPVAVWALFLLATPIACSVYDDGLVAIGGKPAAGGDSTQSALGGALAGSCSATSSQRGAARCREDAGAAAQSPGIAVSCGFEGAAGSCGRVLGGEVDAGDNGSDLCPDDNAKRRPGVCGCGQRDIDTDGDGTPDCADSCPRDKAKTVAGVCGCGTADLDSDRDGTADCVDACPKDAAKTSLGACGCDAVDSDSDGDGTADCIDGCVDDPGKTGPGVCGCGQADSGDARVGSLYCVRGQLLHRYSFDGTDTTAIDSVGRAPGTIVGGTSAVQASGAVSLSGESALGTGSEGYVSLASAAWTGLRSATFECWVTWRGKGRSGAAAWQRIFDFGDQQGTNAHSYIFLTPEGKGGVRTAFSLDGNTPEVEVAVVAPSPLPLDTLKHLAVVVDEPASLLALYVDGMLQGVAPMRGKLSELQVKNLWLGRSNYSGDPAFFGRIHEFRIYAAALNGDQLRASYELGPDYVLRP